VSELRDVIARAIASAENDTHHRYEWHAEQVITAIGDSGRVVVDRARFDRIAEALQSLMDEDGWTNELVGLQPGDLEPLPYTQALTHGFIPDGDKWGANWRIEDGTVYVWNVISHTWVDRDSPPSDIEQAAWDEYIATK